MRRITKSFDFRSNSTLQMLETVSQTSINEIHKLAASAKEHANRVWQLKETLLHSNNNFCG
jgi:hypothetical protein